jgi:Domain of unknown function (DUF4911)
MMVDSAARYFQVNRRDLVYLKFILEAYEGLATLSTVDREGAIVRVGYPRCFSRDVHALLHALGKEIELRETPPQAGGAVEMYALAGAKEDDHAR